MAFLISNLTSPQGYNTKIQGYNIKIQGYNTEISTKALRNPGVGDFLASLNPELRAECSDLTLMRRQFLKDLPRDRSSLRVTRPSLRVTTQRKRPVLRY